MGVEPFLLPSTLNLMVSQRLIRRLCDHCKTAEPAPLEIAKIIDNEIMKLSEENKAKLQYEKPYKIYHAPGCQVCRGKGAVGRVGIFEVLSMSRELEEIINAGPTEGKIYDEARRQGMITLRQDGILKALAGLVTAEEVIKETVAS
jgi:type II secretory ATPase GspE/PulE/Tfp pilus assembly ATPase PilB-like protein